MKLEELRDLLLKKRGAVEDFPFGPDVMVFKVAGKMFALLTWGEEPMRINLKCDPDLAVHLRAAFPAVLPGYHMNKKHWNTVVLDGSLPEEEFSSMVEDSYNLVVRGLKKADRLKLETIE